MCLILFAFNQHPDYKFILAANRDEFFHRPTLYANHWQNDENIIGGQDVSSGGTWLGLHNSGRFIAITNYRNPESESKNAHSRGELSKKFLTGTEKVSDFIKEIALKRQNYNGFNLLLSDDGFQTLFHYSNISNKLTQVENGIHGLSNALLDTPWPKVTNGKEMLSKTIASENIKPHELISLLMDKEEASDEKLPQTGISFDLEKKLSPVFISMKGYGTRCSTALLLDSKNRVTFLEVSYNEKLETINESLIDMQLKH